MTNLVTELANAAAEAGGRPAVRLDDRALSYSELDAAASRAAGALRDLGVQAGDRVGLQLPNVPQFPVVVYGALRLGAVVVPMNPLLSAREVAHHLADSGARTLVDVPGLEAFERRLAAAQPVVDTADRADDDAAVIVYTSGTTGTPKGAVLTHANLASAAAVARELVDGGPDDVTIAALPLFHVFGMSSVMNATLLGRGQLTLVPRFDAATVLDVLQRDRATTFCGVPTMYTALLQHAERSRYDVSSLKLCVSGGSALPVEVLRGFDEAFSAEVLEGYGLTETAGMATFNPRDRERKLGSIGLPVGGSEIRLVDDEDRDVPAGEPGELVMRGPFVMRGYWRRDEATADVLRGGWFHTGDMARVDEDGYFFIVDRKKDLIIRGGYNVYPREIEEVLYEHPAVLEAAVLAVPHDDLGEEIGAAVVLKPGQDASAQELRDHVKGEVAAYKYPRHVWFLDELPKGPTGKILKREIDVPRVAAAGPA